MSVICALSPYLFSLAALGAREAFWSCLDVFSVVEGLLRDFKGMVLSRFLFVFQLIWRYLGKKKTAYEAKEGTCS